MEKEDAFRGLAAVVQLNPRQSVNAFPAIAGTDVPSVFVCAVYGWVVCMVGWCQMIYIFADTGLCSGLMGQS